MAETVVQGSLVRSDRIWQDAELRIADGHIVAIHPGRRHASPAWKTDGWVVPGLIDLHGHGGGGDEVMDADPDGLARIARRLAADGTTGFLAATMSADRAQLLRAMRAAAAYAAQETPLGAALLGIYAEGPFFNPVRAGAQLGGVFRAPCIGEMAGWWEAAGDLLKIVVLAPELAGVDQALAWLSARAWLSR